MTKNIIEIPALNVRSLCWDGDELVDWASGGSRYGLDGSQWGARWNIGFPFDAATLSPSGRFAVVYQRTGTTGAIIVDDCPPLGSRVLRQIHRDFDNAKVFEYPITLFALPDGREVIAHCPNQYNVLEIDDLATGERLTRRHPEGELNYNVADDFYHSRLSVNPSGTRLLSAGWIWQPMSDLILFEIADVLRNPTLLDHAETFCMRDGSAEVSSAAFIGDDAIIVTSARNARYGEDKGVPCLRAGTIAAYDLERKEYLSIASLEDEAGTVMPLDLEHAVGFYGHPKLIHLPTGRTLHRWPNLSTGEQLDSIIGENTPPPLALDPNHKRFAVADSEKITVVSL